MPLDGKFDDNVVLQIKNGPMDFKSKKTPQTRTRCPLFLLASTALLFAKLKMERVFHQCA